MNLRLLGNDFALEIVNRDDPRLQGAMGKLLGLHQLILLADTQSQDQLRSTLLHEFLEFCDMQMHLELGERSICCLETGLYAMFSDNGVSLGALVGKEKKA